jgi:hypothetical protein
LRTKRMELVGGGDDGCDLFPDDSERIP